MKVSNPFKNTNGSHWYDATIWLIYNLCGSLAPVWFGLLILETLSRKPAWSDFSQHGEFALYSAAMFAPTLYIVSRDLKVPGFTGRQVLNLLTILGMLAATCFFVAVTTAFMEPKPIFEIDQIFLRDGTVLLFGFSVILSFFVTVLDNARLTPDVREITTAQQNRLSQEYDDLGGTRQ